MLMQGKARKIPCLFIIYLLFTISSHAEEAKNITFSFAPQDGTTYIQKLTTTREKRIGAGGAQLDESISTTKISIKKTKEGWDVIAKPENAVMKRNGQVVNSPFIAILSKITIVHKLNQDGTLKDILGYEGVEEAIKSQFPPQFAKKIAPLLNSETLKKREMAERTGRVDFFLGKTVSPGDVWEYNAPFSMPNGTSVNYKVKTSFNALQSCGKARCIKIEQVYDSDEVDIADSTNKAIKSAAEGSNEGFGKSFPMVKKGGSSIKGKVVRLIEPTTMLIHEEVLERTIQMEMQAPGAGPRPIKMVETRVYKYEY